VELTEQMGDTDEAIGARVGSLDTGFATPKDVCVMKVVIGIVWLWGRAG